jgi:hypothetical protein
MKTAIALFALAFGATIPLQGAAASQNDAGISKAAMSTDISAAKKKKKRYQTYVYPQRYGYYYYPPAFSPGDPSWQSPELRRLRALNRCAVDLGYGRWENCD